MFLIFGCSTYVPYNSKYLKSRNEAEKIIKQVILEQPRQYAPVAIEFNEEYFQVFHNDTRKGILSGGVTTVPVVDTIYFNNIKSVELYYRKLFIVMIKDNTDYLKLYVYTRDENKAKSLIDALHTLISENLKNTQND